MLHSWYIRKLNFPHILIIHTYGWNFSRWILGMISVTFVSHFRPLLQAPWQCYHSKGLFLLCKKVVPVRIWTHFGPIYPWGGLGALIWDLWRIWHKLTNFAPFYFIPLMSRSWFVNFFWSAWNFMFNRSCVDLSTYINMGAILILLSIGLGL